MTDAPRITVVTVNYKVPAILRGLLDSVPDAAGGWPYEIVVVDNASNDGSVEMLRAEYPHVTVIANPDNVGFARGNNIGAEHGRGAYLALVNPDVALGRASLARLCEFLAAHPRAGMVGPRIQLPDGTTQSFTLPLPSTWEVVRALPASSLVERGVDRLRRLGRPVEAPVRSGYIHGACMVLTRTAFDAVHGVPTDTFMYGEEALLGHRLKKAGFEIWYDPTTSVLHREESSANLRFEPHEKALRKRWGHAVARAQILPRASFVAWNAVLASRAVAAGLMAISVGSGASERHFDFVRLHWRALHAPRTPSTARDES